MPDSSTDECAVGRPILLRPSVELRQQLESEATTQKRSLNNLLIVIIERYFKQKQIRTSK